ncbi:diacylglycerol acyltransferase [Basidiobolus meristosporus CBS 931.73]|uniref:Diacylglycerol O-acyltransferase n=1 Tax=Basidiobolus meristosporus CBS 931.73 TaxID=1314790 RepID=A0A1Y1XAJ5_9FUNG|nr:diacylglycerol acyltransferase [Basidiobolus meristosporus CBS 931.73]|eukprot:ORX82749.1 diacylglycerol acyltransferase [Basidiobolus meristosporus CBS 931.73]
MVRIAPINIPLRRRRQTTAVAFWVYLLPLCLGCFLILLIPTLWPLLAMYLAWLYLDDAPSTGGRSWEFWRRSKIWKWYCEFFPVALVKTEELDPSKNYIFGYHPHGIIAVGAFAAIATEGANVSEVFPGLNIRLLTLDTNFKLPFYRDLLLGLRVASVSRRSCENILRKGPGHSCMIVVGGATESLSAFPGTNDLVLKKRVGFVKLSLKTGASLVPVFGFGENDIFDQVASGPGTKVRHVQSRIQQIFGFTVPLFYGRGIFNYDLGILPHRRPIVVVVGKPIEVEKMENPTEEDIKKYHDLYIKSLEDLYNQYKDVYAKERVSELRFIA